MLDRCKGMFALAIWDRRERRLLLARDRVGKKPLCWTRRGTTLLFGSEIRAILTWPEVDRRASLEAIHHYLSYAYVPAPLTAFADIFRLEPGHLLEVAPGKAPRLERYAALPMPRLKTRPHKRELREALMERLDCAVAARVGNADVPVGALLSGGTDSSLVVALMARHASTPIHTFTIGFDDPGHDERAQARRVAEHLGTIHHETVLAPADGDDLEQLVRCYGEPFADPSALATLKVCELARGEVSVALSGDGGDETFLGYSRYAWWRREQWVRRFPKGLRRAARRLAENYPVATEGPRAARILNRLLTRLDERDSRRYRRWMSGLAEADKRDGYGEALQPFLAESALNRLEPLLAAISEPASAAAWADMNSYLPDDLLVKIDIAGMAHGLELRSPFLDQDLMEFAAGISAQEKMPHGELKGLLKSVAIPLLPSNQLARPKQGFGVPLQKWLSGPLGDQARELLLGKHAARRGLLAPQYVERLFREHTSGVYHHHPRLWSLMVLEQWLRTWIDPSTVEV